MSLEEMAQHNNQPDFLNRACVIPNRFAHDSKHHLLILAQLAVDYRNI